MSAWATSDWFGFWFFTFLFLFLGGGIWMIRSSILSRRRWSTLKERGVPVTGTVAGAEYRSGGEGSPSVRYEVMYTSTDGVTRTVRLSTITLSKRRGHITAEDHGREVVSGDREGWRNTIVLDATPHEVPLVHDPLEPEVVMWQDTVDGQGPPHQIRTGIGILLCLIAVVALSGYLT